MSVRISRIANNSASSEVAQAMGARPVDIESPGSSPLTLRICHLADSGSEEDSSTSLRVFVPHDSGDESEDPFQTLHAMCDLHARASCVTPSPRDAAPPEWPSAPPLELLVEQNVDHAISAPAPIERKRSAWESVAAVPLLRSKSLSPHNYIVSSFLCSELVLIVCGCCFAAAAIGWCRTLLRSALALNTHRDSGTLGWRPNLTADPRCACAVFDRCS
jgi:hypothetical protein